MARHEVLRTVFEVSEGDVPLQRIEPPGFVPIDMLDLSGATREEQSEQVQALARKALNTPFDLVRGPLLRSRLVRFGTDEYVWLLTVYHIVLDGLSPTRSGPSPATPGSPCSSP